MHLVNREFVEFGRTTCYFIDDMYNIIPGVVQMADEQGRYIIEYKVPNTPNQYELIRLTLKEIRYTIEEAKTYLIELLKTHITETVKPLVTVKNMPDEDKPSLLLLYKEGDNIFENDPETVVMSEFEADDAYYSDFSINNHDKKYFGIISTTVNKNIIETSLVNASVYNNGFNIIIDYNTDCHLVTTPDDYRNYRINLSGLEDFNQSIQAYITPNNSKTILASTEIKHIETENITFNRFIKEGNNRLGLTYYRPGKDDKYKRFDLYLQIGQKIYKHISPIEDFESDVILSFSNFIEANN